MLLRRMPLLLALAVAVPCALAVLPAASARAVALPGPQPRRLRHRFSASAVVRRRNPDGSAQPAIHLAARPPMGWNSWDSFAITITGRQARAQARWMAAHLRRYGWRYFVIDEGWFIRNPAAPERDAQYAINRHGLYVPAPNRFPGGFAALARYLHGLGLRFGVHLLRGIPRLAVRRNLPIAGSPFRAAQAANPADTCSWNGDNYGVRDNAAGQAYYNSLMRQLAGWGVDFVKVDCIASPYDAPAIHMIHQAILRSGRPIVLSLSPGPAPLARAADLRRNAQMWRISDDVWDHWGPDPAAPWSQSLAGQFARLAAWAPYAGGGHWSDADMLPLGYLGPHPGLGRPRWSRFTPAEAQTLITLWASARSPLIFGGNMLRMNPATLRLLADPEVIAVDQDSHGNRAVLTSPTTAIWRAQPRRGPGLYAAVFNLTTQPRAITVTWRQLGLPPGRLHVRDLWRRKDLGAHARLRVRLAAHAAALFRLTP